MRWVRSAPWLAGSFVFASACVGGCGGSDDAVGNNTNVDNGGKDAAPESNARTDAGSDAARSDAGHPNADAGGQDATNDATGEPSPADVSTLVDATDSATPSDGGSAEHEGDAGPNDASDETVDADAPSEAPYPAPHPAPPQIVDNHGPVLAAPKIVPVFFANDDPTFTSQVNGFLQNLPASSYWNAVSEYGVGAGTTTTAVALAVTASGAISDADIQTWLTATLNADDPGFPYDDNALFVLHYPAGATVSFDNGGSPAVGCIDFSAYHDSVTLDASHGHANVAYVVVPRCNDFNGFTGIDAATAAESGSLMAALTDPYPSTEPGWASFDDAHVAWTFVTGAEIGAACSQDPRAFTKFADLPYTVQRVWSNASAAAGHDPCLPLLPVETYFNAAVVLPDTASFDGVSTEAVQVPVGESRTVELDLFSDGPTSSPLSLSAIDLATLNGSGAPALSFSFDGTTGQNGDKRQLTVHAEKAFPSGMPFAVFSTGATESHFWVGLAVN